jgi:hypothetical protein
VLESIADEVRVEHVSDVDNDELVLELGFGRELAFDRPPAGDRSGGAAPSGDQGGGAMPAGKHAGISASDQGRGD